MIDPYLAVALQTKVKHVKTRNEVQVNLDHIGNMIEMVTHMCSLELPVRLIALGEGAIQGFVDEILDMNQAEYAKTMAAEIPGQGFLLPLFLHILPDSYPISHPQNLELHLLLMQLIEQVIQVSTYVSPSQSYSQYDQD